MKFDGWGKLMRIYIRKEMEDEENEREKQM